MDYRRNVHLRIHQHSWTVVVSFLAFTRVLGLTLCIFGALIRNGLDPILALFLKLAHVRRSFSVSNMYCVDHPFFSLTEKDNYYSS